MSYADKRGVLKFTARSGNSTAANQSLDEFILPKNRELEILNLRASIKTANGWAANAKLTDSAGTTLASVALTGNSGAVNSASQTASAPVKLTYSTGNQANGDTVLRLVVDADLQAFVGTIQADFTNPGAK